MSPVEFTGGDEAKRNMATLRDTILKAGAAALTLEANLLATDAKRVTPVDLGALRNSIVVSSPEIKGAVVSVEVGAGGPAAPYALAVHEIPPPPAKSPGGRSARHKPPTQWKFLETPARQRIPGMADRLAKTIRDRVDRGGPRGPAR